MGAGLIGALCAGLFLFSYAQSASNARAEAIEQFDGELQQVLVAREQIDVGTVLTSHLFEQQLWPQIYLPEGAIAAQDYERIEGHRTSAVILAGEVATKARIFDQALPLDRLAEGMTAVTLSTDNVHALGGELVRGMHLSLMAAVPNGRVEELAHSIEVLSANTSAVQMGRENAAASDDVSDGRTTLIGGSASSGTNRMQSGNESITWVTLAIPDAQVEQVLTAARAGAIHLVLPAAAFTADDTELDE